jgi:hypothetical protein
LIADAFHPGYACSDEHNLISRTFDLIVKRSN